MKGLIPETYCWRLATIVPSENTQPGAAVSWHDISLQAGDDSLAQRTTRKIENDGLLDTRMAGTNLRLTFDTIPLWRGDHVSVKQLADDFATYLYLPRLRDANVLLSAITDGVASIRWDQESFAYADSYDETRQRYLGLKYGQQITPGLDGLVVRPEAALRQIAADEATAQASSAPRHGLTYTTDSAQTGSPARVAEVGMAPGAGTEHIPSAPPAPQSRHFFGSVALDPQRAQRDAANVIQEVIQHLTSVLSAQVDISIEIHAKLPDGAPEHVIRAVSENCRTLKFTNFGFE